MYQFFEIQVCVTWVWHRTQVYENRVSQKNPLRARVYETRVRCDILPLCFKHCVSIQFKRKIGDLWGLSYWVGERYILLSGTYLPKVRIKDS